MSAQHYYIYANTAGYNKIKPIIALDFVSYHIRKHYNKNILFQMLSYSILTFIVHM